MFHLFLSWIDAAHRERAAVTRRRLTAWIVLLLSLVLYLLSNVLQPLLLCAQPPGEVELLEPPPSVLERIPLVEPTESPIRAGGAARGRADTPAIRPIAKSPSSIATAMPSEPAFVEAIDQRVITGQIELAVGQSRLLTLRRRLAEQARPTIALADPNLVHVDVLPDGRTLRFVGQQAGITDLAIRHGEEPPLVYSVQVKYDLDAMVERLRRVFPGIDFQISQVRGVLLLEGSVAYARQSQLIERALIALLPAGRSSDSLAPGGTTNSTFTLAATSPAGNSSVNAASHSFTTLTGEPFRADPRVINLLRIPGQRQVMLKVRIGELNRSALREIGADWFVRWSQRHLAGARIAGAEQTLQGFQGIGQRATAFGIFPTPHVEVILRALTDRGLLQVMAEPNLVALDGERASFLAGGQFPVPIPQGGGATGGNSIQFKEFGVQLEFLAAIVDDETLRLKVAPEVSTIDRSIGATLVTGGDPVPGLITRKVATTVELRQGQTLALAGLLQTEIDGRSQRLPAISDLPYLGPLFTNTSHRRMEKELVVLVSPILMPNNPPGVPAELPGRELQEPTDREFFLESRLERHSQQLTGGPNPSRPTSPLNPTKAIQPASWMTPAR